MENTICPSMCLKGFKGLCAWRVNEWQVWKVEVTDQGTSVRLGKPEACTPVVERQTWIQNSCLSNSTWFSCQTSNQTLISEPSCEGPFRQAHTETQHTQHSETFLVLNTETKGIWERLCCTRKESLEIWEIGGYHGDRARQSLVYSHKTERKVSGKQMNGETNISFNLCDLTRFHY